MVIFAIIVLIISIICFIGDDDSWMGFFMIFLILTPFSCIKLTTDVEYMTNKATVINKIDYFSYDNAIYKLVLKNEYKTETIEVDGYKYKTTNVNDIVSVYTFNFVDRSNSDKYYIDFNIRSKNIFTLIKVDKFTK